MRRGNYPALKKHCQEHHEMNGIVLEFRQNHTKNHEVIPSSVLGFL
jgi:hemerythrin